MSAALTDPPRRPPPAPSLRRERALFREGVTWVIGCDEVGRGAIAGPVAVGVAAIRADVGRTPRGLRDSKLLSEAVRETMEPRAAAWSAAHAVGMASADEIDEVGIIRALGRAGWRALEQLVPRGVALDDAVLLLDGNHDYLRAAGQVPLDVRTRIRADQDCAAVSAASVIAKVRRDRLMIRAHEGEPAYRWNSNKGYASVEHRAAIREHGVSGLHRRTWLSALA